MKTRINLSVYLIVLFFTLTACGERTDGLYGTRYSRSELEEMGVNTEHLFIFSTAIKYRITAKSFGRE